MEILASNKAGLSVVVSTENIFDGKKNYLCFLGGVYYDPRSEFKSIGKDGGRQTSLNEDRKNQYNEMLKDADTAFENLVILYTARMRKKGEVPAPGDIPPDLALVRNENSMLSFLERTMVKAMVAGAQDEIITGIKPAVDRFIKETYGILPKVITVESPEFGKHSIKGVVHEKFETVLKFVTKNIPVFLSGPAGTGKNVIAKQVAEALGKEFYFSNAVTQEHKITGFIDANGRYHDTQFYKAFVNGGVFLLDEIDASIPEVLIMLNAALANRYFDFPTGRVDAHKDFRVIAAGNTFGTGSDLEYTGRYQLDAASLDRFALIEVDYSPKIEEHLASGDKELLDYIRGFRNASRTAHFKHIISYRAIERIHNIGGTVSVEEALRMCLLKNTRKDDLVILHKDITSHLSGSNKYVAAQGKILASM